MSDLSNISRKITNKRIQQIIRYHTQHGTLRLFSTTLRALLQEATDPDCYGYLEGKSLYREEMLQSVPADQIWYYDSPETIEREEPTHFGRVPDSFLENSKPLHRERPFVCELDGITIVGPTANPKTSDGRYVRQAHSLSRGQLLTSIIVENLSRLNRQKGSTTETIETGVVFTNLWATNHFHWQIDFLPRLRGVNVYKQRSTEKPTLIIGPNPPKWQFTYLDLLGYDSDDIHVYDGKGLNISKLVVTYGTRYKRSEIRWVSNKLLERVDTSPNRFSSKIYISRDDALCRRIINEEELMTALYDRGFIRVKLSELSIKSQIQMFAQADTVVGPHGAGFANLMFSDDDVSVIELFGAKEGLSTFDLAEVLDQEYACIQCDTVGEDLIADVSQVTAMLDQLQERTTADC